MASPRRAASLILQRHRLRSEARLTCEKAPRSASVVALSWEMVVSFLLQKLEDAIVNN